MPQETDKKLWSRITAQIAHEWQELPECEQTWISGHVRALVSLQKNLHQLFLDVGGEQICRQCDGDCCGHGKFHPTLTNLLACLVLKFPFPDPDFHLDCPYMGQNGCLFLPELRPYNCISFICEQIEVSLNPENLAEFYRLEKEIRAEYEQFAARYVGAGMRGIMIRGEILPAYLAHS